jgi:hypothetical protein
LRHRFQYGADTVGDRRQIVQDRRTGFGVKVNMEKGLFKYLGDIFKINTLRG